MARLKRRPRVRCRLRCHVMRGSREVEARITSLSEGGLGLLVPLEVEQGETLDLRILPHRGDDAVIQTAMVWNDQPARGSQDARLVGCVVSMATPGYLELFASLDTAKPLPPDRRVRVARPKSRPKPSDIGGDLPRSREPLPPPKPEPEEHLPNFRVRLKQRGGPRTRSLPIRANGASEAEAFARSQLAVSGENAHAWELIEVVLLRS